MSKGFTVRTNFRCIGRTNIDYLDSFRLSFVFHKFAQLIKCPAVQPRTVLFTGSNALTNVFQVFHKNRRTTIVFSFLNDFFGYTVIHVFNMALFSARDIPQSLFSGLRTFALKALPMCQKLIPRSSKDSTSKQLTCGGGSKNIFSKIYTHSISRFYGQNIGQVENEVKKPAFAFTDKLGFLNHTPIQKILVKRTNFKFQTNPSAKRKKRKDLIFQRIGSFIKMDRTPFLEQNLPRPFQCFQSLRCFCNRVATHLCSQLRKILSECMVVKMVQTNAIFLRLLYRNASHLTACGRENCLQFQKSQILRERNVKLNGNRSFHTGYSTENNSFKTTFEERRFLPGLKAWVSALSKG